jgi:hypothetical protein
MENLMKPKKLTLANWQSELKRLETQFNNFDDKASTEAKGILDNIDAVRQIIREIKDSQGEKGNFSH